MTQSLKTYFDHLHTFKYTLGIGVWLILFYCTLQERVWSSLYMPCGWGPSIMVDRWTTAWKFCSVQVKSQTNLSLSLSPAVTVLTGLRVNTFFNVVVAPVRVEMCPDGGTPLCRPDRRSGVSEETRWVGIRCNRTLLTAWPPSSGTPPSLSSGYRYARAGRVRHVVFLWLVNPMNPEQITQSSF